MRFQPFQFEVKSSRLQNIHAVNMINELKLITKKRRHTVGRDMALHIFNKYASNTTALKHTMV